jgi:hypothetical protein
MWCIGNKEERNRDRDALRRDKFVLEESEKNDNLFGKKKGLDWHSFETGGIGYFAWITRFSTVVFTDSRRSSILGAPRKDKDVV